MFDMAEFASAVIWGIAGILTLRRQRINKIDYALLWISLMLLAVERILE